MKYKVIFQNQKGKYFKYVDSPNKAMAIQRVKSEIPRESESKFKFKVIKLK